MEKFTLSRTGKAPLSFEGELVSEAAGQWFCGREQNRYHNLRLYRTAAGTYVLAIEFQTTWQGEADVSEAWAVDPSEVGAELEAYNPTDCVVGFPPSPAYADKQARLMDQVRRIYQTRVTDLLDGIDDLAERIE